uniref:EGF-like domain-containing protein n=1 Tax=Panagrellus redivivus TaxID=6233 RepID=A0A7E4ZTF6_PANRE
MQKTVATILFLIFVLCSVHGFHRKRRGNELICVNGTAKHGACECDKNFVGRHCERKMFCRSNERDRDGSCLSCQENYEGIYCDRPICKNGQEDEFEPRCVCNKPYSGEFCDKLVTSDVYHFYNTKMVQAIGPLGALTLIPLFLIYYGCEYLAQKRQ